MTSSALESIGLELGWRASWAAVVEPWAGWNGPAIAYDPHRVHAPEWLEVCWILPVRTRNRVCT